jgi:multiple sugar transport system permease protein
VDGCTRFQAFRLAIVPSCGRGHHHGLFSFLLAYNDFSVTGWC